MLGGRTPLGGSLNIGGGNRGGSGTPGGGTTDEPACGLAVAFVGAFKGNGIEGGGTRGSR